MEVGKCEVCGSRKIEYLCGHEIVRCGLRKFVFTLKAIVLVVCNACHGRIEREAWPKARQLACLRRSRPNDYDLEIVNRWSTGRISQEEVEKWP
jgi:hypothetical protein